MDDEDVAPVYARVYTDFFKRDAQIYALGDIRFNKPKSLKTVGYTLILLFLYSFPLLMVVGPDKMFANVVWFVIIFGPPVGLGSVMSKPLFHNKPLLKDIKSLIRYFHQAPTYTDLQAYPYDNDCKLQMTLWLADADCYDDDSSVAKIDRIKKKKNKPAKQSKQKKTRDDKKRKKTANDQSASERPITPKRQVPKAIPLNDAARQLLEQGQLEANEMNSRR